MKKVMWVILGIVAWTECSALEPFRWNETYIPDFRLVVEPVMFTEVSGGSLLFEAGRQNYRANGTVGYAFDECFYAKISGEYLTQKLGFSFCSKKEHHWVEQGAVGFALQLPFDTECGFSYSHANKQSLRDTVVPLQNLICMKQIAGSDGFRLFCGSQIYPWESGILTGKLVYDYLKFDRSFQKDKVVQGIGFTLALEQYLYDCAKIKLGLNVEAPFISYDASIATRIYVFGRFLEVGIYGQRVHGLKSIPSSSRIGIEIGIDLEHLWSGEPSSCRESFASWVSQPAVYMPQVLVMKDQTSREFGNAPYGNLPSVITLTSATVDFDLSRYFTGTTPIIYEAIPLPAGLALHPVSGKITGTIAPGSYDVTIKATNYFGTHSQLVTFNY